MSQRWGWQESETGKAQFPDQLVEETNKPIQLMYPESREQSHQSNTLLRCEILCVSAEIIKGDVEKHL